MTEKREYPVVTSFEVGRKYWGRPRHGKVSWAIVNPGDTSVPHDGWEYRGPIPEPDTGDWADEIAAKIARRVFDAPIGRSQVEEVIGDYLRKSCQPRVDVDALVEEIKSKPHPNNNGIAKWTVEEIIRKHMGGGDA